MNKKSIITMMLALVTMTGLAQTKTATVTGYSPDCNSHWLFTRTKRRHAGICRYW